MICAMPNTNPSIVDGKTFNLAKEIAERKAYCDYALYLGATPSNAREASVLASQAAGLKMYLNSTFGTLKMDDKNDWKPHFDLWPRNMPLCVHAEGDTTANAILLAQGRPLHVCHVARKAELEVIKSAKSFGLPVTCEVCPHHLFLTEDFVENNLGPRKGQVRPCLVSEDDRRYLWDNIQYIDTIGTDHAPHTMEEKLSDKAPPGFPGLETMLPLMLTAVNEGKLTLEELEEKMYHNPRKIFGLPKQEDTYIEVNLDEEWTIPEAMTFSKAKWTPFAGMKVTGRVKRVVLRGEVAYVDGQLLAQPGYGQDVRQWKKTTNSLLKPPPNTVRITEPDDMEAEGVVPRSRGSSWSSPNKTRTGSPLPTTLVRTQSPSPAVGGIKPLASSTSSSFQQQGVNINTIQLVSRNNALRGCHVLNVSMFDRDVLHALFHNAEVFKTCIQRGIGIDHILRGKLMASVFFEPSTRTSASFSAAMQRLGGSIVPIDEVSSSQQKGQ